MKILLVDDDDSVRHLLDVLLRTRGHEVFPYPDAESALGAIQSHFFPLIILDWYLPGIDGLELCARIRNQPRGKDSVILVFTSANDIRDLNAVLAAGADDYMSKPLHPRLLEVRLSVAERQVKEALALRRAEEERDLARRRLEASHADLRSILDQLRLGTILVDRNGRINFASRTVEALFDLDRGSVVGKDWRKALPLRLSDLKQLEEQMFLPYKNRQKILAHSTHRDDSYFSMEIEVREPHRDQGGCLFVIYDVTEVEALRRRLHAQTPINGLIGESAVMLSVSQQIRDLALVDSMVLLEGDTGTGKEVAARAIHDLSPRRDKPFVAVNCAAITESLVASQLFGHRRGAFTGAISDSKGLFESAEGGTLFLDEIGDIPPMVQTGLLRVLQEREITRVGEIHARKINVRVIAATHQNLQKLVEMGRFRQDLLYRIRVARLTLPPLKDRADDIRLLATAFLHTLATELSKPVTRIGPDTLSLLMSHHWPGNVRELRSAIEYALIRCVGPIIKPADLPPELLGSEHTAPLSFELAKGNEQEQILAALRSCGGNRSKAARLLEMSRATFYRRLKTLGIELE